MAHPADPTGPSLPVDDLIEVVYRDVYQAAAQDVVSELQRPPGRNPPQRRVELSAWYNALPESDRARVAEVAARAAEHAVFGMLALIDNVRPVTPGFSTELRLYAERAGAASPLEEQGELHNHFRSRVDEG